MDFNTCDKCKNWDNADDNINTGFGFCKCVKMVDASKSCHDTGNKKYFTKDQTDCALYFDHEGYEAEFVTGAKFGCIHFCPIIKK